jgi:hypothetical protein
MVCFAKRSACRLLLACPCAHVGWSLVLLSCRALIVDSVRLRRGSGVDGVACQAQCAHITACLPLIQTWISMWWLVPGAVVLQGADGGRCALPSAVRADY